MNKSDETALNKIFDEVRSERVEPSDDLMSRILEDAQVLQPEKMPSHTSSNISVFAQLKAMIGGWPALSGVAAAGVAGLWIGLAPPDDVEVWMAVALGQSTEVSLGSGFDVFDEGWVDG